VTEEGLYLYMCAVAGINADHTAVTGSRWLVEKHG